MLRRGASILNGRGGGRTGSRALYRARHPNFYRARHQRPFVGAASSTFSIPLRLVTTVAPQSRRLPRRAASCMERQAATTIQELFSRSERQATSTLSTISKAAPREIIRKGFCVTGGRKSYGTVFEFDPVSNQERVIHSFEGPPSDGVYPEASAIVVNGNLYSTTQLGGGFRSQISRPGAHRSRFSSSGDGEQPLGALAERNGTLCGIVFRVSP
jgi:hypothetical protein